MGRGRLNGYLVRNTDQSFVGCLNGPLFVVVVEAEGGETGKVDSGCSGDEIGKNPCDSSGSGFASAVGPAGQVPEFAFNFWSGGPVLGFPFRGCLIVFRFLYACFVTVDPDLAAQLRRGALVP